MRRLIRAAAWVLLPAMAAPTSAADCSRADVDHYLDRGFTPAQVVALCGTRPSGAAVPARDELLQAIAGFDAEISDGSLRYARETCVTYGPENLAGRQRKACGVMRWAVALDGLEVVEQRRRWLLFGRNAVRVRGAVTRTFEFDRAALGARDRRWLDEALANEDDGELDIPLREGEPPARFVAALRKLAGAPR